MVSLCFPYGSPITCVCDPRGHVYNCFPTDTKGKMASYRATEAGGGASIGGRAGGRGGDQRTEIVLATTALVAVVALFLSFLIYRLEKCLVAKGFQLPIFNCKSSDTRSSSAAQTDPVIYCYSHSQTVVGITHLSQLPPPPPPPPIYPTLPQRRFSYSPDSAVDDSFRPSLSSTLPFPRSRSRSSRYEMEGGGDQQVPATPIEHTQLYQERSEVNNIEGEMGLGIEETKQQSPFPEEVEGFYGQSDCSSQLPLLDFMRLPDPDQ